jgi:heat shock protein HtpX
MNRLKTLLLLATLSAIFVWVGGALGGQSGLVMGLAFAGLTNFAAYWWSDKLVLRMHGAQEVSAHEAPDLHRMVQQLAQRAGMPMPKVYIIPEEAPNAFATGRNPDHAAVAVTQGIMRVLNREELNGVLAHELAHVKNRDTLIMTVAATLAGALSMIANMAMWGAMLGGNRADDEEHGSHPVAGLVGIIIAPIAASLIQMAISRSREFIADATGARFSGTPLALANALRKIEACSREIPMSTGSPASAHMFIINPFSGGGLVRLFSTHPSTEERVRRLEEMALRGGWMAA